MEAVLTGFWAALELCFYVFLWRGIFSPRVSRNQYCIFQGAGWLILTLIRSGGVTDPFGYLLSIGFFTALSLLLNRGPWYEHLIAAMIGAALGTVTDNVIRFVFSAVTSIPASELVYRQVLNALVVTVGKLVFVCLGWYVPYAQGRRGGLPLRGKWLPVCLVFTGVSLTVILSAVMSVKGSRDISLRVAFLCGVVVAANGAIFFLVGSLEKSMEKLKASALLNQQMEIQTEHIVALEKSYRAQRQATHDFRSQLQTVSNLLAMGKPEEAEEYTRQLLGQQTTRIFAVNSCHPIIDAVLNHKYQLCREQGIDIRFQVNDLSVVNLPTDLLVVLLSNLLDNAIEGCLRAEGEKAVSCILTAEDALFLSVRNTANPVTVVDDRIPTSKENPWEHGYGLERIQSVMEKLHGEYTFDYRDGWFSFAAEIPLEAPKASQNQ